MIIQYDFYTLDTFQALEALKLAKDSVAKDSNVTASYDDEDDIWNICGGIDHKQIDELFTFFEENDFSENRYELLENR